MSSFDEVAIESAVGATVLGAAGEAKTWKNAMPAYEFNDTTNLMAEHWRNVDNMRALKETGYFPPELSRVEIIENLKESRSFSNQLKMRPLTIAGVIAGGILAPLIIELSK